MSTSQSVPLTTVSTQYTPQTVTVSSNTINQPPFVTQSVQTTQADVPLQPIEAIDVEKQAKEPKVSGSNCCVCNCCFPAYKRWGACGRTLFILGIILGILAIGALCFVLYCIIGVYPANEEAVQSLNSAPGADYSNANGWYTFKTTTPTTGKQIGLVFLPGAKVNAQAYAPMCKELVIAGRGEINMCVVTPVPLNLAFFGTAIPGQVASANPQINSWIIGGHSLGGAFACQVMANVHASNPNLWRGVQTLAAYCPANLNTPTYTEPLSSRVDVVAFQGTNDGVQTMSDFQAKVGNFPQGPGETDIVYIEGGNHAQMGYYGPQSGDNPATISLAAQQAIIVNGTLALARRIIKDQ
jgi:hypothetical protein